MAFILIDDTHDQVVRGDKTLTNALTWIGIASPVPALSLPNQGRIYWDAVTKQFMHSDDGGPWMPFARAGKRGAVTFLNVPTMQVSFPVPEPDTDYFVALSSNAQEVYSVTSKTINSFNVNSSNGDSTATVDWVLVR